MTRKSEFTCDAAGTRILTIEAPEKMCVNPLTSLHMYVAAVELLAARKEIAGLREGLAGTRVELLEAADKFWVIHCNHPGEAVGRAQGEDKAFCAVMSKRMANAARNLLAGGNSNE